MYRDRRRWLLKERSGNGEIAKSSFRCISLIGFRGCVGPGGMCGNIDTHFEAQETVTDIKIQFQKLAHPLPPFALPQSSAWLTD